jgi:hypothetical protein
MKKQKFKPGRKRPTSEKPDAPLPMRVTPADVPKSTTRARMGVWGWWKEVWAFVGPLITLTTFSAFAVPQVSIEPSINLDPAQPLATQFRITNKGHFTVYSVRFSCALGGGPVYIGNMVTAPIAPVASLPPGASVTRGCVLESQNIEAPDVRISATYNWPWPIPFIPKTETAHFAIKHGATGFFLVPDLQR